MPFLRTARGQMVVRSSQRHLGRRRGRQRHVRSIGDAPRGRFRPFLIDIHCRTLSRNTLAAASPILIAAPVYQSHLVGESNERVLRTNRRMASSAKRWSRGYGKESSPLEQRAYPTRDCASSQVTRRLPRRIADRFRSTSFPGKSHTSATSWPQSPCVSER